MLKWFLIVLHNLHIYKGKNMHKLLLVLLAIPAVSFAASLDMSKLQCRGVPLNTATTLADVQKNCMISKQTTSSGRYEVEFTNDATKKSVKCFFPTKAPTALLNGCEAAGIL